MSEAKKPTAADLLEVAEVLEMAKPALLPFIDWIVGRVVVGLHRPLPPYANCAGCFFYRLSATNPPDHGGAGNCFLEPPVFGSEVDEWLNPVVLENEICRHWTPKEGS